MRTATFFDFPLTSETSMPKPFTFTPAFIYLERADLAREYLAKRPVDASKLREEMNFKFHMSNVLRCEIYGHSILIETKPCSLHTFACPCEFKPRGEDIECLESVDQAIAYILAVNW